MMQSLRWRRCTERTVGCTASQDAFAAYLAKLPEEIKRDEVSFVEARRLAIAKHVDADKDGVINLAAFKAMFVRRYVVGHAISMTDGLEVSKSKARTNLS